MSEHAKTQPAKRSWIGELPKDLQDAGLPRFGLIPTQVLLDSNLSGRHLRVYMCLCIHANSKTGECMPGQARIAEMCGYFKNDKPDVSLVSQLIKHLATRGWLTNLKQRGYNMSNRYVLKIAPHTDYNRVVVRKKKPGSDMVDFKGLGFDSMEAFQAAISGNSEESRALMARAGGLRDEPEAGWDEPEAGWDEEVFFEPN